MFDSCICLEADDVVQLLSRNNRTARKRHTCCECGAMIQLGDIYSVDVTVFEGDVERFETCIPCVNVRASLFSCGWIYGGIWEAIHEMYCDKGYCVCPEPQQRVAK